MGSGGEMLKIDKTPEPAFFKKVRENPRIRRWDDVPHEGRDRLKRHIEYVAWSCGHLLMIRDVPALRCQGTSHEYPEKST